MHLSLTKYFGLLCLLIYPTVHIAFAQSENQTSLSTDVNHNNDAPLTNSLELPNSIVTPKPKVIQQTLPISPSTLSSPILKDPSPNIIPSFSIIDNGPSSPSPINSIPSKISVMDKLVEATTLGEIDPQSIGLLSTNDGGLGTAMWKGTDRALLDKLLPALTLPVLSPTLNTLAERLLLTTAGLPNGKSNLSLIALRIDRLLAIGDVNDAWKLAMLAKPQYVNDATLRQVAEASLAVNSNDVCLKLPDFLKIHNSGEWQELQVVCQLKDGDMKMAQLSLELLRSEDIKDDIFYALAEKNVIGGSKLLPRQLTPLKSLTYSLLTMTNLPLPGEIYSHPPAVLISSLIQTKTHEDNSRLALAEHAAAEGILSSSSLALAYHSLSFTPELLAIANLNPTSELSRQRAIYYQSALQEKSIQKKIEISEQFLHSLDTSLLNGNVTPLLAEMVGDTSPSPDLSGFAVPMARLYLLSGKSDLAFEWLKQARVLALTNPILAHDLSNLWPLIVFSGLETDDKFAADLYDWLDTTMKLDSGRISNDHISTILLLLEATGYSIPEDSWIRVAEAPVFEKHFTAPAWLFERLRDASSNGRRGETVLLCLLLYSMGSSNDVSPYVTIETVRALRLVGLTSEALALARETSNSLLMSPAVKP